MLTPLLDLYYSQNGDFVLNGGDLQDTVFDIWEGTKSIIRSRVCGITGDWRLYPQLTANLNTLQGQPNTKETGLKIKQLVQDSLTKDGFLKESDFTVRVVPVSFTSISIFVILKVPDTTQENNTNIMYFTALNYEQNFKIFSNN